MMSVCQRIMVREILLEKGNNDLEIIKGIINKRPRLSKDTIRTIEGTKKCLFSLNQGIYLWKLPKGAKILLCKYIAHHGVAKYLPYSTKKP